MLSRHARALPPPGTVPASAAASLPAVSRDLCRGQQKGMSRALPTEQTKQHMMQLSNTCLQPLMQLFLYVRTSDVSSRQAAHLFSLCDLQIQLSVI